jgi:hypothetical protein
MPSKEETEAMKKQAAELEAKLDKMMAEKVRPRERRCCCDGWGGCSVRALYCRLACWFLDTERGRSGSASTSVTDAYVVRCAGQGSQGARRGHRCRDAQAPRHALQDGGRRRVQELVRRRQWQSPHPGSRQRRCVTPGVNARVPG